MKSRTTLVTLPAMVALAMATEVETTVAITVAVTGTPRL